MSPYIDKFSSFGTYPKRFIARFFYTLMDVGFESGWLGRKVVKLIRQIIPFTSEETIVDAKRFGLRWRLYPHDNYGEKVILIRPYNWERKPQRWILDRVKSEFFFIDIGANCGVYALRVSQKMKQGKVVAIEPGPTVLERLRFNVELNSLSLVTVLGCAVGDITGTVGFSEAHSLDLSQVSCDGPISVEMRTLLEIVEAEKFSRLDAIKVDVEGYEDRVLGPFLYHAPESLLPGIIVAEHILSDSWELDWISQAKSRDYRERDRSRKDLLLIRE